MPDRWNFSFFLINKRPSSDKFTRVYPFGGLNGTNRANVIYAFQMETNVFFFLSLFFSFFMRTCRSLFIISVIENYSACNGRTRHLLSSFFFFFFLSADNIKFALTYLTYARTKPALFFQPRDRAQDTGTINYIYAPSYSITARDKYFMRRYNIYKPASIYPLAIYQIVGRILN